MSLLVIDLKLRYHSLMADSGNRIVRSLCSFTNSFHDQVVDELDSHRKILESGGFTVQTRRICLGGYSLKEAAAINIDRSVFVGAGTVGKNAARDDFDRFIESDNISFNIDLSENPGEEDVAFLFRIIRSRPGKTFHFAFTFNNPPSSPFFPSSTFSEPGFTIGLQPMDLSEGCESLEEWFQKMSDVWKDLIDIFGHDPRFIGIDSSVAPLYSGKSSLVNFIKKMTGSFSGAVTTDVFLRISEFIKVHNPRRAGLCGIMFPCLEDFELAAEYESGNFPVERNVFLSLHSGLGIDTYPVSVDESGERVLQVLRLLSGLSRKYKKPLSARFISDGKTLTGQRTDFGNQYLKDVVLRKL